jgi:hypothetical protein
VRRGCRCRKVWLTRIDYYYYYYPASVLYAKNTCSVHQLLKADCGRQQCVLHFAAAAAARFLPRISALDHMKPPETRTTECTQHNSYHVAPGLHLGVLRSCMGTAHQHRSWLNPMGFSIGLLCSYCNCFCRSHAERLTRVDLLPLSSALVRAGGGMISKLRTIGCPLGHHHHHSHQITHSTHSIKASCPLGISKTSIKASSLASSLLHPIQERYQAAVCQSPGIATCTGWALHSCEHAKCAFHTP